MSDDAQSTGDQFHMNHYQVVWTMPPSHEWLEAVLAWLESEMVRLDDHLRRLRDGDGSIPDDNVRAWSMTKGSLDQTRLFYSLVNQALLAEAERQEAADE